MTGREDVTKWPTPSGTVTFLFSDIEGSTQRWDRNRSAMQEAVRLHDRLIREAIGTHGGHVFKTIGDAFCAAFATPESAAMAAIAAQFALSAEDFSTVGGLRVRMAMNTGIADERHGDYFGPAVSGVARLLALGHGEQILLSGIAADLVRENPPAGATLTDLGAHPLRDRERPERVYQLVVRGLRCDFPRLRVSAKAPWLVTDAMRTPYFTGRDALLSTLRQQLGQRKRAALSGLGGVGKSQAALQYAAQYRGEYLDGVFWINAETVGGMTAGFAEIARALRLPTAASSDQGQVIRAVLDWLEGNDGWLLILDNVEDRRDVARFVPAGGKGHLLITSREPVLPEFGIPRALEVRDLGSDEAVEFLFKRSGHEDGNPDERSAASDLAAELGNLPLALEQAAAFIAETRTSFAAYLSAYRKRRIAVLEKAKGLVPHETVAITWAANIEAVRGEAAAAADLLRVSAFLAPDSIPFEVFETGAAVLGDSIAEALADVGDLTMVELLQSLARYSLVRIDAPSRAFGVHRLVQDVVRDATGESERRSCVERAIAALGAAFPEVRFATWSECERLAPHIIAANAWLVMRDALPDGVALALNQAGKYLTQRGRYAEAELLLERALAIRQCGLAPEHADLARNLDDLAHAYFRRGKYAEAQTLLERAVAIRERAMGADHADIAISLNGLAEIQWRHGHYAAAERLYERALAIRERAQGPDHPDVATSLNNLAIAREEKGQLEEAVSMHERALAIRERAFASDHPDIAQSLNNLAYIYYAQGRLSDAEAAQERAVAILEQSLGPNHPHVAESLVSLATTRLQQGRYAEARRLHERVLPILERAYGHEHADVALSLSQLAMLCLKQRLYAEAEPLYERALAMLERTVGPDHRDIPPILDGLASIREEQGRDAEAIALLDRALAIIEQTLSGDRPEIARIRERIERLRVEMRPAQAPRANT